MAGIFVPVLVVIALLAVAVWTVIGPEPALNHAFVVTMYVLSSVCRCAPGLPTPMSVIIRFDQGGQAQVLIRDTIALQTLRGESRTVAMAGDGINDARALAATDVGMHTAPR